MDTSDSSDSLLRKGKIKKTALFVPKNSYSKCPINQLSSEGADFLQVVMILQSCKNEHMYLNARKLSGKALAEITQLRAEMEH